MSKADEVVVPRDTFKDGLTFLKGVLLGQGFADDSSSVHSVEILLSLLAAARPEPADTKNVTASTTTEVAKEMHTHFTQTGLYRPEDIQRVLGNPLGGVQIQIPTQIPAWKPIAATAAQAEAEANKLDREMLGEAIVAMAEDGWMYHGVEGMSDAQQKCYMAYLKYKKPEIYAQEQAAIDSADTQHPTAHLTDAEIYINDPLQIDQVRRDILAGNVFEDQVDQICALAKRGISSSHE